MNKHRVKGTADEILGTAKRKLGELTNDKPLQVKGLAQQVKGKLESAWGQAKDAVRASQPRTPVKATTTVRVGISRKG